MSPWAGETWKIALDCCFRGPIVIHFCGIAVLRSRAYMYMPKSRGHRSRPTFAVLCIAELSDQVAVAPWSSDRGYCLYLKVRSGDVWPACDWSKPRSIGRDITEGGDWTTTSYCDVCLLFITAPWSLFQPRLIAYGWKIRHLPMRPVSVRADR